MKDIIITSGRIKKEIVAFLVCFFIANIVNLASIIYYNTSFFELITSMGFVLVAAVVFYIVWCVLRLLIVGIKQLKN